jgi:hypothetical protein
MSASLLKEVTDTIAFLLFVTTSRSFVYSDLLS